MIKRFLFKLSVFAVLIFLLDRGIASLLRTGLDNFYGLNKRAGVLCVGHSQIMLGIDGARLEKGLGIPVARYATNGADVFDRLAMIKHYFFLHPDTVKIVVYDVGDHLFNRSGLSVNSYKLHYPYMDSPAISAHLIASAGSREEYAARRMIKLLRFNSATLNMALRGIMHHCENIKTGRADIQALRKDIGSDRILPIAIDADMVKAFDETVRFVRAHKAIFVILCLPRVDLINNTDKERHEEVMKIFSFYAKEDKGVVFLDYNPEFSGRYELFSDMQHMNREGQRLVTDKTIGDLSRMLSK